MADPEAPASPDPTPLGGPSPGNASPGNASPGNASPGNASALGNESIRSEASSTALSATAEGGSVGLTAEPIPTPSKPAKRPTFVFFGIVASVSLFADIASKAWAEVVLTGRFAPIVLIEDHLTFTLAYNRGGAWGLLQNASEAVRRPFFLAVSVAAILFIVSLYSRLAPGQRALKWGLPLVLGGALGNLSDRITRSQVIDFIDYRGDWVRSLNELVHRYFSSWTVTDHWPTFNIADVAICVGVGLMAVDMMTSKRGHAGARPAVVPAPDASASPPQQPSFEAPRLDPGLEHASPPPSESVSRDPQ